MTKAAAPGRVVRLAAGWLLLVAGVAALILPGPGLLLLAIGLLAYSRRRFRGRAGQSATD